MHHIKMRYISVKWVWLVYISFHRYTKISNVIIYTAKNRKNLQEQLHRVLFRIFPGAISTSGGNITGF